MKRSLLKAVLSARIFFIACLLLFFGFSPNANAADITISSEKTWADAQALDGTPNDGVLNVTGNLTITGTGWINGNVSGPGAANLPAATININVTGNVLIQSGGKITADQIAGSCSGSNGHGGIINLIASGNITTEINTTISTNAKCSAGTIYIKAGGFADINGLVESKSTLSGTGANQKPGGGPITIIAGCFLTVNDNGKVSSEGQDPGADLVHLESCVVNIYGLVQSTGAGHALPDDSVTHVLPPYRPEKPSNSTAGVEVWAGTINIDRTLPHNGEVKADLTIGAANVAWIDLFARNNINIVGRTTGIFAVHANNGGSQNIGGYISLKSTSASIVGSGRVIQANGAFGGSGGYISAYAYDVVDMSNGQMNQADGVSNYGGIIDLRSYNAGILSNIDDTLSVKGPNPGSVYRTACTTIGQATIVPAGASLLDITGSCGGSPELFPGDSLPECSGNGSITIKKFVGIPQAGAPPECALALIQDWDFTSDIPGHAAFSIHAGTSVMIGSVLIGYQGEITFNNVNPGTFHVTETFIAPVPPSSAYYKPSNSCQASASDTSIATVVLNSCSTAECTFTNTPVGCQPEPKCVITANPVICIGASAELCAPAGVFTYGWSTGETTQCITVAALGSYLVAITDENGITSNCSATVTVTPAPDCSIDGNDTICPGTTNQYDAPAGMASYSWSISGNGTINGSVTGSSISVTAGSSCGTQYTVSLTVTNNGCSSTCQLNVSVLDTVKPHVDCPANVDLQCGESSDPSNTGTAGGTDNCSTPSISHRDVPVAAGCAGVAGIDRWWKATDACGNADSCKQQIRYVDTTKPSITCPADKNLQCGQSSAPATTGTATATDNCTTAPVTYRDVPVAAGCAGVAGIDRWWKATDACGNADSCKQQIRYVDTTKPVITCPADKNLLCGQSSAPATTGTATATDNCTTAPVTYRDVPVAAGCAGVAGIDRWWKATDACGNADSCKQQIRYVDTTKPVITCPSDKNLQCGQSSNPSNTGTATATDNCATAPVTYRDVPVAAGCAGVAGIDRWWKATDGCGNKDSCLQKIRYVDTTIPTINCVANKSVPCYVASVTFDGPSASDNCDPNPSIIVVSTNTVTNADGSKTYTKTWKAKDACNNYSANCSQSILVPALLQATCSSNNMLSTITANVTGGTKPYSYLWNTVPAQTTQTATFIQTGTYSAVITDAKGCTASTSCSVNTCDGFRTQTLGGWGTKCSGGNPGCYRDAHFAQAFPGPNYLTIGCTNKVILNSSKAVMDFLANGGTPAKLPAGTSTNPKGLKNTFANQLVAATLSVGFDLADPNFSSSSTYLKNLIINQGTFNGWTVAQVIAEANRKIGGCASIYTESQLTDVLNLINSNYDDGKVNQGNLNCPSENRLAKNGTEVDAGMFTKAYPNPFTSITTIEFRSDVTSRTVVEVYSLAGSRITTLFNGETEGGVTYKSDFNGEGLAEGIYVYRIVRGDNIVTGKLILMK